MTAATRRHRRLAAAVATAAGGALIAALSLGATCGPPPPSSDTCTLAVGAGQPSITSIEIGHVDGSGVFQPFHDDQVVPLQVGGQGFTMIVANLRVHGANIGKCLAQSTKLERASGELISSEESPLRANTAGDGVWVTGDALLVYFDAAGQRARIHASAGGVEAQVEFWVDEMGTIDAAIPADAAPDGP